VAKQPVSVLVVIHTPMLEILLLERASHPGFWQSVTGSREGSESLPETARREVFEETGIAVAAGEMVDWRLSNRYQIFSEWRNRYAPGVEQNLEHVFSLCVPAPKTITIAAGEHVAQRWLPWRLAAEQCFSWSNRDAILMLPQLRA
jgi:dATP pyrophosphohydrolase